MREKLKSIKATDFLQLKNLGTNGKGNNLLEPLQLQGFSNLYFPTPEAQALAE